MWIKIVLFHYICNIQIERTSKPEHVILIKQRKEDLVLSF